MASVPFVFCPRYFLRFPAFFFATFFLAACFFAGLARFGDFFTGFAFAFSSACPP